MKSFATLLTSTILLSGCAKEPPMSETLTENALNATTALQESLPVECKTDSIITQFTVVKTEIRAIRNACEIEKDEITREKLKWKFGFFGLLVIIGVFIVKKVLK